MKVVKVNVTVKIILSLEDDESIDNVIQEMDYNFNHSPNNVNNIFDTEIVDFEVIK